MRTFRWILVVPAALAASFLAYCIAGFMHGLGNGFEQTAEFWAATDMHGQWWSGTIAIIWVRGTSGAFSTWIASRVAPSHRHIAARIWFALLALAIAGLVVLCVLRGVAGQGVGFWYRSVLELVALLGGAGLVLLDVEKDAARESARGAAQSPQRQ